MTCMLYTPKQAAEMLGCSTKTLYSYVRSGLISYVTDGAGKKRQRRKFTYADIRIFIADQTRRDSSPGKKGKRKIINSPHTFLEKMAVKQAKHQTGWKICTAEFKQSAEAKRFVRIKRKPTHDDEVP